jgi:hypothetical protein
MNLTYLAPQLTADLVWPALVLESRLLSVAPIAAGLVVEWLVLYFGGFGFSWKKAIVVDVVMNTASSIIGIFLLPILGVIWEFFPGTLIYKALHTGTFNPITWIAAFFLSVGGSTVIEAAVVKFAFKIPLGWKRFGLLSLANFLSTAIAFVSLWTHPPTY